MTGALAEADIRNAVSKNAFNAGNDYFVSGSVRDIQKSADGAVIQSQVRKGGGRGTYHQTIRLVGAGNGTVTIKGTCSCPVGFNCKHIAAVLLAARDKGGPVVAGARQPALLPAGPPPLPPEIGSWLKKLEAAQALSDETEVYPPAIRRRLLYVLFELPSAESVVVTYQSITLDARDRPAGYPSTVNIGQLVSSNPPKYLRPSDRRILARLDAPTGPNRAGLALAALIPEIAATGRGRWGSWDGPVLTAGPPVACRIGWQVAEDGRQRPHLLMPDGLVAVRVDTPWYVDPKTGVTGPIETDQPASIVRAMLAGPWLPPTAVAQVRDALTRRLPRLAAPEPVGAPERLRLPLQPCLTLLASEPVVDPVAQPKVWPRVSTATRLPIARLAWRYGKVTLAMGAQVGPRMLDGRLVEIERDQDGEMAAGRSLAELGFASLGRLGLVHRQHRNAQDLMLLDDPAGWIEIMLEDVPRLRAAGWQVDIAEDFPIRLAVPSEEPHFEVREGSGLDWFDLDLGVMVDGKRISLTPAMLTAIAKTRIAGDDQDDEMFEVDEDLFEVDEDLDDEEDFFEEQPNLLVTLPDGRVLVLKEAQLRPILEPLLALFADRPATDGVVRLSRHHVADLAAVEAASHETGVTWSGGDALRKLGQQLREQGGIPACKLPENFHAVLRPYQRDGLSWLQFLRAAGLGGVLADDMGLGKTVQTLAHLVVEQAAGRLDRPALVICPTSLVANWQGEAARFAPGLRALVLHGADRAAHFAAIGAHDLVITTYPLLARDHAVLTAQEWHIVVLDEAQTIKNPLAATSKLARTLKARQRLCLSGTPLENHLGELWSLFDFLMPGLLGDRADFGRRYRGPIEKGGNAECQVLLANRVAPFLLRRTKGEVAAELPAKSEITEIVEMATSQHSVYEAIRLAMHAKVRAAIESRGVAGSGIIILDALLKLRQACCHPRLLKLAAEQTGRVLPLDKAGSAKFERLFELLPQLLEDGRRVLLFSQFTSMLALIQAELDRLAMPYVLLTGDTKDRITPVQKFQSGVVPLFLISLKAGGVGLNLTAADTVIHYDPWWNPAVENQATDRAHRIGQDKPVFVYRLTTSGTIEEKMNVLKARKQALADGVLGGATEVTSFLTEDDVEQLFAA